MTMLIAFDGSEDARAAIAYAGARIRPEPAVVLTVWEPLLTQTAWPPTAEPMPLPGETWAEEREAERIAGEGARLALDAGLPDARPRAERGAGPVWATIVDVARELDATLIVTGSRGLSGVKSVLLGSVSDRVLHHADRPVLIVPPPSAG
ncbi:universal stress protein [Actinomadura sp. NBRC 104412]|uniref:universal stress protein n=1 Tax=Actinomadura sp. NBRC 104412 TaxID=3032203 RepID=UPI0024A170AB|nr:universal stress protein [Actinomadura sp. NBRC 104412]GLZ07474.1 universal stress protein [Actinomadura sp. NBRC 104412]